jgi:hypothetical protein
VTSFPLSRRMRKQSGCNLHKRNERMLFKILIGMGFVCMLIGIVIALPSDDAHVIITGASLCWIGLLLFYCASKAQYRQ